MKIDRTDILKAVALCALPLAMGACRQELCYNHYPAATIDLSWEPGESGESVGALHGWECVWERDYGMDHISNWDSYGFDYDYASLNPSLPEWLTMIYYDSYGKVSEHYIGPDGSEIRLDDDNHGGSMLFYNGDTEYVIISDVASAQDARATATPRSRSTISYMESRYPNARSTNPPDVLYAAYISDLSRIDFHENRLLPITMRPLVYTYIIRYEFEAGLQYVTLARGALGGMAESVYLRDGTTSERQGIILFDCEKEGWGWEAKVRSFGVPGFPDSYYGRRSDEDPDWEVTLNLEIKLVNGTTQDLHFDITDQLRKQPRGGIITVKGIRVDNISPPPGPEGGFNVDISDWGETTDIELPVGPDN